MKTSVISDEFRERYLVIRKTRVPLKVPRWCSMVLRTITGASKIRRSALTNTRILFMRGTGPIGYPGSAEVVNMQPPAALIKHGITSLACHRRRPAIRHVGLAIDPQCFAGSGGRRRFGTTADRRPGAHRSQQGHRRYADLGRGTGGTPRRAEERRRLSLSAEPDAVAGNPARHGRPARQMAWCLSRLSNISAWRRNSCRETTTDKSQLPLSRCRVNHEPFSSDRCRQAEGFSQAARSRLLRHSQSVERRHRSLSARFGFQSAGNNERRLRPFARLPRRRAKP